MHHLPSKQWLSSMILVLLLYALWASSQDRMNTSGQLPQKQKDTASNTAASPDSSSSDSQGPIISKAPFTNSDISMVFQIISDATGWSIFPSPEVAKTTVTLYPNNISAQELLDQVVSVAGFVYHREGNVITVLTFKEYEKTYEVAKEVIPLKYAEAASVGKVIQPFLTDLGKHVVHKETNTVVLYEVPANLNPISAIVKKLDNPAVSTQVEIVNLKYALCDEVAKILNQVYKPSEIRQVNRTEPSKAIKDTIQDAEADSDTLPQDQVGVFPVIHANQLVIVGIEKDVLRIRELIQEIDVSGENLQLEVIPLQYADAKMVSQTIEDVFGAQNTNSGRITTPRNQARNPNANTSAESTPLASIGLSTQMSVFAIERTNQIIIKAFSADMERAQKLVEKLDVFAEPTTQTYHFSYAEASQVFEGLDRILGIYQSSSKSAARAGSAQIASQTGHSEFGITLIERTNSILLTGPPSAHRVMQSICESVDVPGLYEAGVIRVYQIQNASAEEISETVTILLDVSTDSTEAANTTGRFADSSAEDAASGISTDDQQGQDEFTPNIDAKISLNLATNSIIVKATKKDQREIEKVIATLDVKRKQVIVKAMIVELSQTDDLDLGVELDYMEDNEKAFTSFGLSTLNQITGNRTVLGGTGGTLAILDPGGVRAIVRASQQNDNIRIQSAPQILVTNNTEGSIDSVAEEPTSQTHQGETTTTTSFNEYVEAGTVFKVTPQITKGDYLHMDYQINLSSFGQKSDSSLPPSRSKSEMTSSTTVPDGYTIVLGGIQTVNESKSVTKVPLLGDIPLLGLLFRNTVIRKKYITTYLFVTANIMKDEDFGDLHNKSSEALQEVDAKQNQE